MVFTRRKTLALVGGGMIFAAGAGGWSISRPAHQALAPWSKAGNYEDPRLRALSWAILSPNPHNLQPWKVDISEQDKVVLYVDTDRLLPETDPFNRQIVIGFGCFLETLAIAAAEEGWKTEVELFPKGHDAENLDDRPIADIKFVPGAEKDDDFGYILHRRTQKEPYDLSQPVAEVDLAKLITSTRYSTRSDGTVDAKEVAELRTLSEQAMWIEIETPRTYKESVDLFRIGRAEINANPDGIDFPGPMFDLLRITGQFSREAAMDGESQAYKAGIDAVMENMRTAMGHVWICTKGNTREDQITAGRDWMRMHLAATRIGLGLQPLSQALQEYPEMSELYDQTHARLAKPGETVQMWARVGYSPDVPASPRWPLEAKLMNG
ncbi:MAG: twin-arginine translocation pathway signal protein [Pseudomonadota bacterium]